MRIVLDTNVLISAVMFGGNPRTILEKAIRGEVRLCLCEAILSELSDVLRKPKFGIPAAVVNQIVSELAALGEWIVPSKGILEIDVDPADNRVLECALEADADYIVSGDNHLLDLGKYSSISIVSPHEFLLRAR